MVAFHDPLTEELQRSQLRLSDELIFSPQKYGDETFVHIEIPSTSRFFRIGYAEYVFISQLDGKTSNAAALAITAQSQGADAINEQKSAELVDWLLENGLAGFVGNDTRVDAASVEKNKASLLSKLNPFWIKLPLGNPDKFFDSSLSWCRFAFHPLSILVSFIAILLGLLTALTNWNELFGGFHILASSNWIWLLASWVFLKIIHEFAHGIVCRYFGGRVPETGIIFILFAPMAYVNVTSSWRFSNRWKRIAVACAGMYVELLIASICVFGLLNTESIVLRDILINTIVMSGITTLLFNANPLMRFDGYFVLSDLLNIPNLFENGSNAFRKDMSWIFLGQNSKASVHEIKTRRYVSSFYGWLASIWKVLICFGMTIVASTMFGGFGIILAVFGVISWFGKPTFELFKRLSIHFKRRPSSMLRTGILTSMVLLFFSASWFWIPSPFAARVPCLVEFEDAARVRVATAGFIAEVYATEGSVVAVGEPLLRIENKELVAEVRELQAKLQYEQTRERIALDESETAEAQIAVGQQEAILTSLDSRQAEIDSLIVKAPCAGRVVAKKLASMKGSYLEKGDVVLLISDEEVKEVIVSLPITEIHSARNLLGVTIPIEVGSRRKILATINQVAPRATMQVSHSCLIVPNGGPIAVRQSEVAPEDEDRNTEFEYCHPRLNVVAKLDKSIAPTVRAGERGYAVLSTSSTPTLGKWLFVSTRNWFRKQLEIADPSASSL